MWHEKKTTKLLIQLKLANHFIDTPWSARRSQGQLATLFIVDFGLAFHFFWWPFLISAHVAASWQFTILFNATQMSFVIVCSSLSSSLNWNFLKFIFFIFFCSCTSICKTHHVVRVGASEHVQRKYHPEQKIEDREKEKKVWRKGKKWIICVIFHFASELFWLECAQRASYSSACEILWFYFLPYEKCRVSSSWAKAKHYSSYMHTHGTNRVLPSSSNKLSYMNDCHALNAGEKK